MSSCAYVAELYKAATAATYTYSQSNPMSLLSENDRDSHQPNHWPDLQRRLPHRFRWRHPYLRKDGDLNSGASFTVNSGPFWHGRVTIL